MDPGILSQQSPPELKIALFVRSSVDATMSIRAASRVCCLAYRPTPRKHCVSLRDQIRVLDLP
jgi:hypothetical protein